MENNEHISNAINVVVENILASTDKHKALDESLKFFAEEIVKLNNEDFGNAIHLLKDKLANNVVDFSQETQNGRELRGPIRKQIAFGINSNPWCGPSKRQILIEAVTDYDGMRATPQPR